MFREVEVSGDKMQAIFCFERNFETSLPSQSEWSYGVDYNLCFEKTSRLVKRISVVGPNFVRSSFPMFVSFRDLSEQQWWQAHLGTGTFTMGREWADEQDRIESITEFVASLVSALLKAETEKNHHNRWKALTFWLEEHQIPSKYGSAVGSSCALCSHTSFESEVSLRQDGNRYRLILCTDAVWNQR